MTPFRTHPSVVRLVALVRERGACPSELLDLLEGAFADAAVPEAERPGEVCRLFAEPPDVPCPACSGEGCTWQGMVRGCDGSGRVRGTPHPADDASLQPLLAAYAGRLFGAEVGARVAAWKAMPVYERRPGSFWMLVSGFRADYPDFPTGSAARRALKRACLAELDGLERPDGKPAVRVPVPVYDPEITCKDEVMVAVRDRRTGVEYNLLPHPGDGVLWTFTDRADHILLRVKPSDLMPPREPSRPFERDDGLLRRMQRMQRAFDLTGDPFWEGSVAPTWGVIEAGPPSPPTPNAAPRSGRGRAAELLTARLRATAPLRRRRP